MAKRLSSDDAVGVYEAAAHWVEACLRDRHSLFTLGASIWTAENFAELNTLFVDNPDLSKSDFLTKLRGQLDGASPDATQLMAEVLYIHLLITLTTSGAKKREIINEVLSWMPTPVSIPSDLDRALEHGLVNPGTFYSTGRDRCLNFVIQFGQAWNALNEADRAQLLEDPWAFRDFLWTVPVGSGMSQRNALLHLSFPDFFEAITSDEHKRLIGEAFADRVADPSTDIDRRLASIRSQLEPTYGPAFDYYDAALERQWKASFGGDWEEFVGWAAKFFAWDGFDSTERDYKIQIAGKLEEVRRGLLANAPDWLGSLRRALSNQHLTPWQANDKFLKWAETHEDECREALLQVWGEGEASEAGLQAFLDQVPTNAIAGRGTRTAIGSLLLMARDPLTFAIFRPEPFKVGYQLTGVSRPSDRASEERQYGAALDFLDRFTEEAASRDLLLRDRLDAQALLWCVAKWDPLDTWTPDERQRFKAFRGDVDPVSTAPAPSGSTADDSTADSAEAESLEALAQRLFIEPDYLADIVKLLRQRRQLIFHGPPGTGKTYVARALAGHLAGEDGTVTLVQFHPSYTYEDFVEGYRPTPDGTFVLRPGPLKKIADLAREHPESTHVLVIDELNRGNLAKVLGELYFLLEYRTEQVELQYSDEPFTLPKNLLILGTMNTADRSIAIVDGALRRRFHFVGFYPDEPPVAGLLRAWLKQENPRVAFAADMVDRANELLGQRNVAIGPSHFMKPEFDEEWIRLIWDHSVLPYIEEQLYGEEHRLADFDYDRIRALVADNSAAPDEVTDDVVGSEHSKLEP